MLLKTPESKFVRFVTLKDPYTISLLAQLYWRSVQILHRMATMENTLAISRVIITAFIFVIFLYILNRQFSHHDGLPIVNRTFSLEPRIFSGWRWAFLSDKILDEAYAKVRVSI